VPWQPPSGPGGGRRRRGPLIGAAALALVIAAGAGAYLATSHSSSNTPSASGGSSPAPGSRQGPAASSTATAAVSTAPVCAAGALSVAGSTAFQAVATEAATAYVNACPQARITVTGGDSAFGVTSVRDAVSSGSASAGSMIAMYDGTTSLAAGLQAHPAGVLIYSVIAHNGLFPGSKVTSAQLAKIFISHSAPGKVVVGRLKGSGSRLTFLKKVLQADSKLVPPDARTCPAPSGSASSLTGCTVGSTAKMLDFVNNTPNAIGYAEALGSFQGFPQVSVLWIDNTQPSRANVLNRSYKYWTVEHLYTGPQPTPLATDFLNYLPHYIQANTPADFISCADAAADCAAR
jgi:phosphate transport system substrate-binding protein